MQSQWWSHRSHPQSVLGGEKKGVCEKRLGHSGFWSVPVIFFTCIFHCSQQYLGCSTGEWWLWCCLCVCVWHRDALWDSKLKEKEEKIDVPDCQKRWCVFSRNSMWGFHLWRTLELTCVLIWAEFDRYELQIYEEVAKMPPFQRKTLILIGAQGVGRRSLKNRLTVLEPLKFGTTVPCECVSHQGNGVIVIGLTVRPHVTGLSFSHFTASQRRGE